MIFDGPFYLHTNTAALARFKNSSGMRTGGAFGMARSIKAAMRKAEIKYNQPIIPIVAWDSYPIARKEMYPDYKADRVRTEDDQSSYQLQKRLTLDILAGIGIPVVTAPKLEADDIAAFASADEQDLNLIATLDNDWLLLVSDNTFMWHHREKKWVTPKSFPAFAPDGMRNADLLLKYKCFFGDSDNIKPVMGECSKATILKVLTLHSKCTDTMMIDVTGVMTLPEWERNRELIALPNQSLRLYYDQRRTDWGTRNYTDAETVFKQMEAKSLYEDFWWRELAERLSQLPNEPIL